MNNKLLLKKTQIVMLITLITMIGEIFFGYKTHSMSLLADGFHMGTHEVAFIITAIVCYLSIKYQNNEKNLEALGGYTSAILLGLTAIAIITESVDRFFNPLSISFIDAIIVAIIGLTVNVICIMFMGENHEHNHACENSHHEHKKSENLNFKAMYMHILADAFTSLLAISALLLGKYFGLTMLDPFIGLLGGIVIAKWAIDLLKSSGKILLNIDK